MTLPLPWLAFPRLAALLLCLLGSMAPAAASHLVGGELTYRYLDNAGPAATPYHYEITARVYYDAFTRPMGDPTVQVGFTSKDVPGAPLYFTNITRYSYQAVTAPASANCSVQGPTVILATYITTVYLPPTTTGYVGSFSLNARNAGITNLANSSGESMSLTVDMAPGTVRNASPVFTDNALFVICLGDTATVVNNAYDVDGDRLTYSLGTPYSTSTALPVRYAAGYGPTNPFGTPGYAAVDARTGVARYMGRTQGTFLLAIDVQEHRVINGKDVVLGSLRRDVQVVVRSCASQPNEAPTFTRATLAQQDFQVTEGDDLNFNIVATDPEGQSIGLSVSSLLLDGLGGVDATVNGQVGTGSSTNPLGTAVVSGPGIVTGAFRLRTTCGMARAIPYDVVAIAQDYGCNSKITGAVFRIFINKTPPPARITGDSVLCSATVATYAARAPAFGAYRWRVRGGQVLGPATRASVQVRWTTPGPGVVSVRGVSATGCLTDSVTRTVAVGTGPAVQGPTTYCQTANANQGLRYTIAGPPAAYQWSIANGTLLSGQGSNEVLVDLQRGAAATLQVTTAGATCPTVLQITPDDSCLAFYNVITPNGDGQNDAFVIENLARHPGTALTVFNRWGRQVFHSPDYDNSYGGASPGVYYYQCVLANGTRYKGWFEVMR